MKKHIDINDSQIEEAANIINNMYDGTENGKECKIHRIKKALVMGERDCSVSYYYEEKLIEEIEKELYKREIAEGIYTVKREEIEEFSLRVVVGILSCVLIHIPLKQLRDKVC